MIVDFHSHILPGADHGSRGCDVTAAQLAMMHAAGTDAVVATPHFYPNLDTISTFLERRAICVERLLTIDRPVSPTVYLGAEVLVCEGIEEMEGLERLAVEGTRVILLEMPFRHWSERLLDAVTGIAERGLIPVLAHVDRYEKEDVLRLMRRGIRIQLNAEPLARLLGKRRLAPYLESQLLVALGSDLHGAKKKGYAHFLKMQKRLGARTGEIFSKTEELLAGATPIERIVTEKEVAYT